MPSRHDREVTTVTIVGRTAATLLVVLACTACGVGRDPLAAPDVGSASSTPAVSQTPAATTTPLSQTLSPTTTPAPKPSTTQPAQATLPRGGQEVFPRYRLVGYAGVTGASTLGRLGTGPLNQRVAEIERTATPYAAGRRILPVVEVIATVVQGNPGKDRKSTRLNSS